MKKTYTKPALRLEYFTLTQSIARSCGWNDGFGDVYWVAPSACGEVSYPPDFDFAEVCYNSPNGQPQIFAS